MAPLLELEDVRARYGPVQALHGVSLSVEEGQICAVLGANGAGKTTTLRAISNTVRRDGTQKAAVPTMQTREELYDYLDYHAYERKLDELFAGGKSD